MFHVSIIVLNATIVVYGILFGSIYLVLKFVIPECFMNIQNKMIITEMTKHTSIHIYMHRHIHIYIHTYIHIYIHTYIRMVSAAD